MTAPSSTKHTIAKTRVMLGSLFALAALAGCIGGARAEEISPEQVKFFESKIRPVLIKECYGCHSNKSGNVRGGLRLDTRSLTHIGGSSGPAVVPGDLEESLLFNAINHEDWVMPPKRKLPDDVIEDFRQWIEMGAPDPRVNEVSKIQGTVTEEDIEHARENFWAYQEPKIESPPANSSKWATSEIDKYVVGKLEEEGLAPAKDAEGYKVLRRLCFDLVGLPPTPEQVQYFVARWKKDPDQAVEFVVDSLLEKKQFGERWGRHWLDVARYAESTGREVNMTYPHAWRYRDYVIDSFNEDKPFNEFVQEQLAGDLLPVEDDDEWAEHLVATTFLAMGAKNLNEQNRIQFAVDQVDEQIDASTRVFMGMSVACARCHDHKFDAFPQTDYYALAGVFRNMTTFYGNPPSEYGAIATPQRKQNSSLIRLPVDDPNPFDKSYSASELSKLKEEMQDLRQQAVNTRGSSSQQQRIRIVNQMSALSDKLAVVDDRGQPISYTMGVQESGMPQNVPVLVRGEIDQQAQVVDRGFPQVLCSTSVYIDRDESGRLKLAKWIGSDQNTLTARVMVNRIWKHLIGKGLVTSTENFGVTGAAPSHPELLDYLAVRFVESGWSVKSLVREIATSRVYRISSEFNKSYHEADPDNALLWRANPRRLDAESIRDAMLSISGELDLDRPRGSEVAKAGYVRVRSGVLGNPRDLIRDAVSDTTRKMIAENSRRYGGGNAGRGMRPGQFGGQRMQQGGRPSMQRGTQGGDLRSRFRGGRPGSQGGSSQGGMAERMAAGRDRMMSSVMRKVENQLDMEDAVYRSVYLPIVRDELPRSMEVFDFADASTITGSREASNTSNQALYMMNNPFVLEQSDKFAARIASSSSSSRDRINQAFQLAYGRNATSREADAISSFIRSYSNADRTRTDTGEVLSAFCQSLFASAEFRLID